jgi:hypothetical protein
LFLYVNNYLLISYMLVNINIIRLILIYGNVMFHDRVIRFNIYVILDMGFIFYWNRFIRFVCIGFEIVEVMYSILVNKYVIEIGRWIFSIICQHHKIIGFYTFNECILLVCIFILSFLRIRKILGFRGVILLCLFSIYMILFSLY